MSLRARDVDRMWEKLGYTINEKSDHVRAQLWVDGKLVLWTRRSHGKSKIEGPIPDAIRRQMRLNQVQFRDAVACPLTRDAYFEILRDANLLPQ